KGRNEKSSCLRMAFSWKAITLTIQIVSHRNTHVRSKGIAERLLSLGAIASPVCKICGQDLPCALQSALQERWVRHSCPRSFDPPSFMTFVWLVPERAEVWPPRS